MTTTSPGLQTRCSLPRRNSILPLSIHTICSFEWLHHTSIPWSPDRMRRLMFSLICSSGKAANVPKPTNLGINSSQLGSSLAARGRRNAQLLSAQRSQCAALKWSRLTAQTISVLRYMIARFSRMSGPIAQARIECWLAQSVRTCPERCWNGGSL
jgi:hypothetical protein